MHRGMRVWLIRTAAGTAAPVLAGLSTMGGAVASAGCDAVNGGAFDLDVDVANPQGKKTVSGFAVGDEISITFRCFYLCAVARMNALTTGDGTVVRSSKGGEYDGSYRVTGRRNDTTLTLEVISPGQVAFSVGRCKPARR
jgi:hypothetical protein